MACCCGSSPSPEATPRYRRVLWIALVVNALMFGVEMLAGVKADSTSLMADSLDFLVNSGIAHVSGLQVITFSPLLEVPRSTNFQLSTFNQ